MKKLFFISIVSLFLSLSQFAFAQIVTPDDPDVCYGETIEYKIDSSYYGDLHLVIIGGVFIVPTDYYPNQNDSTFIDFNADSTNNNLNIRWDALDGNGEIIKLYGGEQGAEQETQDFDVHYLHPTWLANGQTNEEVVLTGNKNFYVTLYSRAGIWYNYLKSANITFKNFTWTNLGLGTIENKYKFQITGDQPGWISFKPYFSNQDSLCSNLVSWDTIYVKRKLNTPSILGYNSICNSYQTYTVTSYEAQTETFTWNVTDGLKIYKNGQYLTTYTGSETSVQVYEPNSGSGNGYVKVKANATDYVSSDEALKMIWFGDILPMNIRLNDAMSGFPKSEFCYGDPNLVEATYIDGDPYIDEWGWDVTGAYITIENPYGDKSRATIHPTSYSSFNVKLRAHNTCGWSGWADMGVSVITCGGYYMTMYPNPATSFVEISFTKAETIEPDITKSRIKLKDNKNDKDNNIDEYLVQILDKNGIVRKSIHSKSLNMNIDIRDLEPGTYYLHLTFNDELYKQQLIIQ